MITTTLIVTVTPFITPTATHEFVIVEPAYALFNANAGLIVGFAGLLTALAVWHIFMRMFEDW